MYQLTFYVPETHLEKIKNAFFETGAGKIGNYDCCCWQTKGTGQFRPLENSTPFIGESGKIKTVSEYKVEMVCQNNLIKDIIKILKKHHPYEEPAYSVWKLEN